MRGLFKSAGCVVAVLCMGTAAWAGAKSVVLVNVDAVNRLASGTLGSARNSTDTTQYIGCSVQSFADGSPDQVTCYARNAAGTTLTCTSQSAALAQNARSLSGDSLLFFQVDASGECANIQVIHHSRYEPKN